MRIYFIMQAKERKKKKKKKKMEEVKLYTYQYHIHIILFVIMTYRDEKYPLWKKYYNYTLYTLTI